MEDFKFIAALAYKLTCQQNTVMERIREKLARDQEKIELFVVVVVVVLVVIELDTSIQWTDGKAFLRNKL